MERSPENTARQNAAKGPSGYSRWDRLCIDYDAHECRDIDIQALRFERRTAIVTQALRTRDVEDYTRLAQELAERTSKIHFRYQINRMPRWWVTVAEVGVFVWAGREIIFGLGQKLWYLRFGSGILAIVLLAYRRHWSEVRKKSSTRPYTEAFVLGRCIDCDYQLDGTPDAIEPALLNGAHVGPTCCPECGALWPRVPPEARLIHGDPDASRSPI